MNRFPTGHGASFRPALVRIIAAALLVSALFFPPCLAGGDSSQIPERDATGYGFFLGFAALQVATKAPVNVSTTPVVVASPVRTVQTAVQTTVATPASQVTVQGTAVTPGPTAATTGKVSLIPALPPQKLATFAIATPLPFATKAAAVMTMAPGTAATYCLAPTTKCGGTCVDTTTDARNCGYCGQTCEADQHCSNGKCVSSCPSGEANLYTDTNNCGVCGYQCPAGKSCFNGNCADGIAPEYHDCGNGYVSFNNDYHCGACFHHCLAGTQCGDGLCRTNCGGTLIDLESDPNNCGQCGSICTDGVCCDGSCIIWPYQGRDANCRFCGDACPNGMTCQFGPTFAECGMICTDSNGVQRWITSTSQLINDDNCGGCNIICASGTHCANGLCRQSCTAGSVLCSDNTCIPEGPQDCGFCGNACPPGGICTNRQCTCPEGYGLCNGACVELGTRSHCGNNCQPCPAGFECKRYEQSQGASCVYECPYGYRNCGDGSCKNVQLDRQNCGACGNACAAGQYCINGACVSSCPAGSMDCQNDGTCDDPLVDPLNCGGCGISCEGQDLCVNGVCQGSCGIGAIYENRCFNASVGGRACSDKRTDSLNCGGCGWACNLHQTCVDGWCEEACPANTHWCDGPGCTDLMFNRNHCGTCGHQCLGVCIWGICVPY
jgi:hypothetical protein